MRKDISSTVLEKVGSVAVGMMKLSANSTSIIISHQPKLTKNLNQFKNKK